VFFFGGILFALFVMENNKSSNDKSDNNHGKWRDTKKNDGNEDNTSVRDGNKNRAGVAGTTIKIEQQ
jgi:hypothetical protein